VESCAYSFNLIILLTIIACRAKYPIAISSKLLDIFGPSFCVGYDIGCQFRETIRRTSLSGLADKKSLNFIVPGFHGYGHNRLCQLSFLPLYVEGMGLEDFEGCERAFSRSNEVAKTTQHASQFR
jgi:Kyakuja-Dileera-Zisupton transposase